MARVDEHPDERDTQPLQLQNTVDCPECDTIFDVVYTAPDGVFDNEDLVDAPVMEITCPNSDCGYTWEREYEGWLAHEDAG